MLASIAVAVAGEWETISLFNECPGYQRTSWRPLLLSLVCFMALGFLSYAFLLALSVGGVVQFAHGQPNGWVLGALAIGIAQGTRIEARLKTDISGSIRLPGDRESYYSKGLRMARSAAYRALLKRSATSTETHKRIKRGLVAAFDEVKLAQEFEDWARVAKPSAEARRLTRWLESVVASAKLTPESKRRTIAQRLLSEDLDHAKAMAIRRAPAIIDRREV